ncbi:MAG TPA: DnaJ domain-containing protein [Nitrososphaeraceae archaeon]
MDIHKYYSILGVSKDATLFDIKKSYRFLVKKYHPDRNSGKEIDSEMIKKINIAFEVLSDKNKRLEYDDLCSEIQKLDLNHYTEKNITIRNNNESIENTTTIRRTITIEKSRFKIIIEPSLCMAFGSCEILAPNVFHVETNKIINPKAVVVSETGDNFESILNAAQTCPTKAIIIIDRYTGNQIFP